MTTILVTGASGQLGRLVLDHLLASGKVAPGDLIAGSRDPAKLDAYTQKGVKTREVDFDGDLSEAFTGIDVALIISTDALGEPGKRQAQHKAAVTAAKAAGVGHILYTSLPKAEESVITFAPDHLNTERAIKESGLPYTILRNGWYAENLFMSLPHVVQSGQWFSATGEGRNSYLPRADMAAAIAGAILLPAENKTYTLTGEEAYTVREIAAIVSAVAGKEITVIDVTDAQLAEGLKSAGLPEGFVPTIVSFEVNTRLGHFEPVTQDAATLSGRKPQALKDFLEANKSVFAG
ncbi:NAD(P)-dependent oxidoreductase [Xaviernesmea oryzae]|uniref:NAD(P)-dependent oxidoreductase n=1 Tax=Xaviernesmea oryzae TaxID=464029 RepID=A0A1Q9B046_9HYPH|nr:SDR family oxidoreductase [Xaviernesmea oryzae]OLP61345.1 NAD(P)-dependent oxidoreductase [Xaviernesmea oryzae]SEL55823.1 NAD(P)H dehydrogenase (quinone) [Xaviernesmea oryzae]